MKKLVLLSLLFIPFFFSCENAAVKNDNNNTEQNVEQKDSIPAKEQATDTTQSIPASKLENAKEAHDTTKAEAITPAKEVLDKDKGDKKDGSK